MITPRQTRLFRVPHLRAFQQAIALIASAGHPLDAQDRVVLVPTRSAAEMLRRTVEQLLVIDAWRPSAADLEAAGVGAHTLGRGVVLPHVWTRGDWYAQMAARLPGANPQLSELEREVIVRDLAKELAQRLPPPFEVRPGLVTEMLALYDGLRRRLRTVEAFERNIGETLAASAELDRGARRLLEQTVFLAAVFQAYEARLASSAALDEHTLRDRLLSNGMSRALRHVIVTVADAVIEAEGLWPADFDLLTRLSGLERIDVIATEAMLATGFDARLLELLPEIEVVRFTGAEGARPMLVAPRRDDGRRYFVARDREEELASAARWLKRSRRDDEPSIAFERTALVYQRPLPYLYVAQQIFRSAGIPYQLTDTLPLASEPFAAAFDLVMTAVTSGFTRGALIALVRSPHWRVSQAELGDAWRRDVDALDRRLQDADFLGGYGRFAEIVQRWAADDPIAGSAAARAVELGRAVLTATSPLSQLEQDAPFDSAQGTPATVLLQVLIDFVAAHERLPPLDDPHRERHLRARAATLGVLAALQEAYRIHGDVPLSFRELAPTIRRSLEAQTFTPRSGLAGVNLVDAQAARYGPFTRLRLLGLIEGEWPSSPSRSIFYPASLLQQIGWSRRTERLAGQRALFQDLIHVPGIEVSVSAFTLEDDAIVKPSTLLEELSHGEREVRVVEESSADRIFVEEALMTGPPTLFELRWTSPLDSTVVSGRAAAWLEMRLGRTPASERQFRGWTGAFDKSEHAVTHVERYLDCPFKYFATHVLRLEEEQEDEVGLSPMDRGIVLHEVLEQFYRDWISSGRGAITKDNLDEARKAFCAIAERRLATLPEDDRLLERSRLLGSAVAEGFVDRALRLEAAEPGRVIERFLEWDLSGEYDFGGADGARSVRVKGKVDRVDLLETGELRIFDYKSGRAPRVGVAVQLPVYAACAEQKLQGHRGGNWRTALAGYISGRDRTAYTAVIGDKKQTAVHEAQRRFLSAIDGIERGEFPPQPTEPFFCSYCAYSTVCRKDYVGDE